MFDFSLCPCTHFLLSKILDLKIQGSIQITQKFVKSKYRQRTAKINHFIYRFEFLLKLLQKAQK